MAKRAIIPPEYAEATQAAKFSPAVQSGDFVFVTGMTGSDTNGVMANNPITQFRNAFDKIGVALSEAGIGFEHIVEMTSYHVRLREHFGEFDKVRLEFLREPFPAWTAVEVAGLRREGALVEIRVIAEKT